MKIVSRFIAFLAASATTSVCIYLDVCRSRSMIQHDFIPAYQHTDVSDVEVEIFQAFNLSGFYYSAASIGRYHS